MRNPLDSKSKEDTQSDACIIYSTFPSLEEAERIAQHLVDKKLCFCTNIFTEVSSIYKWQGKTEKSHEIPIFIKTKKPLFNEVKDFITNNHSYDTPCILQIEITNGNDEFLKILQNL